MLTESYSKARLKLQQAKVTSALETDADVEVDRRRVSRKERFSSESEMEQTPSKKKTKTVMSRKSARSLLSMPIPPSVPTEGTGLRELAFVLICHVVLR